jgi:hypothetical protein
MLNTAESWIEARRRMWERRLDRLDSYLASLPEDTPDAPAPKTAPKKGRGR